MRILLTGTTGKVGGFLSQHWKEHHHLTQLTRREADLRNLQRLNDFLESSEFDILLNPAAVSTPEACQNDPSIAHAVNVEAPRLMAEICARKGARFVHFSTDYVLDGTDEGFKTESSAAIPNTIYGQTKREGELAALRANPDALIVRVSWVFAVAGEAFLEKIIRLIRNAEPLEAVSDKYSMPTSAPEMARALEFLLEKNATGIFHLTGTSGDQRRNYAR